MTEKDPAIHLSLTLHPQRQPNLFHYFEKIPASKRPQALEEILFQHLRAHKEAYAEQKGPPEEKIDTIFQLIRARIDAVEEELKKAPSLLKPPPPEGESPLEEKGDLGEEIEERLDRLINLF